MKAIIATALSAINAHIYVFGPGEKLNGVLTLLQPAKGN